MKCLNCGARVRKSEELFGISCFLKRKSHKSEMQQYYAHLTIFLFDILQFQEFSTQIRRKVSVQKIIDFRFKNYKKSIKNT